MTADTTTDRLRRAVRESGLTPYAISQSSGVSQSVLSRWLRGERGVTLDTADRIAAAVGLRLALTPRG